MSQIRLCYKPIREILSEVDVGLDWLAPDQLLLDDSEYDLDPEEVVIKGPSLTLIIDYPLCHPAKFTHNQAEGFKRRDLVRIIAEHYRTIYAEEEETTNTPIEYVTGLLNRNTTDGKWGITSHFLEDLILHSLSRNEAGEWIVWCDS